MRFSSGGGAEEISMGVMHDDSAGQVFPSLPPVRQKPNHHDGEERAGVAVRDVERAYAPATLYVTLFMGRCDVHFWAHAVPT